jgi:hypothetical protein
MFEIRQKTVIRFIPYDNLVVVLTENVGDIVFVILDTFDRAEMGVFEVAAFVDK